MSRVLLAAAPAVGGCAVWQTPAEPLLAAPVELAETPFFPQRDYLCGPAALATTLGASGVAVHPDQLTESLYVPNRRGTLQPELTAAARRHGRLAVSFRGDLARLAGQLVAGRPVLVLQNLASSLVPRWHYAVVVGYLPDQDAFVLRSGGRQRLLVSSTRFDATWRRAERWALVLLAPGAPPAGLPAADFLQAAAALETTGAFPEALASFRSAARAWPTDPTAALGVANNLYHLDRLKDAAIGYRHVLTLRPDDAVAVHNLVSTELELGRGCAALDALARFEQASGRSDGAVDAPSPSLVEAAWRAIQDAGVAEQDCRKEEAR